MEDFSLGCLSLLHTLINSVPYTTHSHPNLWHGLALCNFES